MDKWACAGELGRLWEELAKTALRGHFCLHLIWPRQVTQLVGDVGGRAARDSMLGTAGKGGADLQRKTGWGKVGARSVRTVLVCAKRDNRYEATGPLVMPNIENQTQLAHSSSTQSLCCWQIRRQEVSKISKL